MLPVLGSVFLAGAHQGKQQFPWCSWNFRCKFSVGHQSCKQWLCRLISKALTMKMGLNLAKVASAWYWTCHCQQTMSLANICSSSNGTWTFKALWASRMSCTSTVTVQRPCEMGGRWVICSKGVNLLTTEKSLTFAQATNALTFGGNQCSLSQQTACVFVRHKDISLDSASLQHPHVVVIDA